MAAKTKMRFRQLAERLAIELVITTKITKQTKKQKTITNYRENKNVLQERKRNHNILHGLAINSIYIVIKM